MDEIDKLPDAVVREVYRRFAQVWEAERPEIDAMRKIIQEKAESTDEYRREADLLGARLNGAVYDSETKWPKHFDPDAEGAVKGDQGTNSTDIKRPCED